MKIKRATQVLSASVCLAILSLVYSKELPAAAMATAYFCDRMDKLFDCLNSSKLKKTGQKLLYGILKGESELVDFLHQQLLWMATWKFQGRSQPQTVTGWQITIKGILMFWETFQPTTTFSFCLHDDCSKMHSRTCSEQSDKNRDATQIPMYTSSP
uniref:Putative transposase n=1 Tax=Ixodes scapularis TaxID=6945 RepID=A0A4D5RV94_IXOSC